MKKVLSPQEVRNDMPITRKWIYADNAATTPVPLPVQKAMEEYFNDYGVNIDRGLYSLSLIALEKSETARQKISGFLGCQPEEFLFTRNCTEAINQVAYSLEHPLLNMNNSHFASLPGITNWKGKSNLVVTLSEHHSNFMPWLRLAKHLGVRLRIAAPDKEGLLTPEAFIKLIDQNTRFVAFQHVSNVTGFIQPAREIIREIQKINPEILILLDGSQAVGHLPVNFQELGCDFYAFSGHKGLLGPQGSGGLCVKKSLLAKMEPISLGGGTISDVNGSSYTLRKDYLTKRFEAGTPATPNLLGLGRAVEYVSEEIGIQEIAKRELSLIEALYQGLAEMKEVEIYGPKDVSKRTGLLSFNISGYHCIDAALALEENWKILTRAGHHCCLPLAKFLGLMETFGGSLRVSLHYFNTKGEVETILGAVKTLARG